MLEKLTISQITKLVTPIGTFWIAEQIKNKKKNNMKLTLHFRTAEQAKKKKTQKLFNEELFSIQPVHKKNTNSS